MRAAPPMPVDRPLSRAYLRNFAGWATVDTPGTSEPTSLQMTANMMLDRNGAIMVRPGLRYLSYSDWDCSDPTMAVT